MQTNLPLLRLTPLLLPPTPLPLLRTLLLVPLTPLPVLLRAPLTPLLALPTLLLVPLRALPTLLLVPLRTPLLPLATLPRRCNLRESEVSGSGAQGKPCAPFSLSAVDPCGPELRAAGQSPKSGQSFESS